ncbi:hypothetical protein [Paraburkholderia antibiotica]|uniref:Uncharacterized protein n=1 Tax=Paraburkholderia antibiotica TaxID=2728839 RepID=A0A7X9X580_9BURK|nr:hypothetical protein [Paraburkholderia antibiotica]NML31661.1 hypothetical protein [Paraburkholderia antibiotica]
MKKSQLEAFPQKMFASLWITAPKLRQVLDRKLFLRVARKARRPAVAAPLPYL